MTSDEGTILGVEAARRLARLGRFEIGPGLTETELAQAEQCFGFEFADDHRAFLAAGLPHGRDWPDWRDGDPASLRSRLRRPVDGVLFDVEHNAYWHPSWGNRPRDPDEVLTKARALLAAVPPMVPVFAHRYLPAGHGSYGHPVLSLHQTDIICYGLDLVDYIGAEFGGFTARNPKEGSKPPTLVPFWRDFL